MGEHVRNGESSQPGEAVVYSSDHAMGIVLALVGMAAQWAFLHSVTFLGSVLGMQAESEPGSAWIVNSLGTFTVFLVIFAASNRLTPLLDKRRAYLFVSASLAAGMGLVVAGNVLLSSLPLNYAGNVVMACGATPLIIMWGELYKYLNPKGEQLLVTLAAAALAIGLYLVEILLPAPLSVAAFMALPAVSVGCLVAARDRLQGSSGTWRARTAPKRRKSPALFFVCIAVFSIPYNYLRATDGLQEVFASAVDWPSVLALAVVVIVAIALAEAMAEQRGVLLVPGFVLFLLSAAMVTYLLMKDGHPLAVPGLLYSGYYLLLAMVYLALGPIVAATDENPTRLFAGAMLANVAGLLLGSLMGGMERWFDAQIAALVVLGATYALLVAGFVLLGSRSYSLFRVNSFDEADYSFEYLAPATFGSAPQGAPSMADAIAWQCEAASTRYRLSAREREVLVELARGRTIASIAEGLVVSENTVKAHTKSIYRKLDVHTREGLLQRVEEAGSEIHSN